MTYTKKKDVIIQTVTNVGNSFPVPRMFFNPAFALATNIQTFHNCWHLQSKLSPPLLWFGAGWTQLRPQVYQVTVSGLSVYPCTRIYLNVEGIKE